MSTAAAIARAELYAAMAPVGVEVKVHTEDHPTIAQVTFIGTNEWICVTIGDRGTGRTTASAIRTPNGGTARRILVRDIPQAIRSLYVAEPRTVTLDLGPDELGQVRPGDRITAINGTPVPGGPVPVTRSLSTLSGASAPSIGIVSTGGAPASLYPDSTIDRGITVERDVVTPAEVPATPADPTPPAAVQPRTISRTVNGVKLHSDGTGGWFTADRRYEIRLGYGGTTECEADHPVRLTPHLVMQAQKNAHTTWAQPILQAVREGRRGFQCPGGSEHTYNAWHVWDLKRGDYALGGDLAYCESWADAADSLTAAIAAGRA